LRETRDHAVAFVDLAESTRMYRELGDAAARATTQRFFARVAEALPRYEGSLVKTMGDGAMCAFPDADRAMLAVSALHAALAQTSGSERALRAHSGISAGRVIVEHNDMFGTVVNIAAYLAAIARSDQILATQTVVDRLSAPQRACARPAYSARLKGDDHESLVHQVIWQTDQAEITNVKPVGLGRLPEDGGALLFILGERKRRLTAFQPRLAFGRAEGNDVVVADIFASRGHAVVEVDTMRFKLIDRSANGTYVAFDGTPGEVRVLRGETLLHDSGRISLGRPFADPRAQPITFKRDQRALYRV
jgi:class 3 adenylate cyclase